ncbi:MAG: hypothetical protein H6872_05825 [Methylobacteriaceae bacterium]|nr:hypothetical protein [Methylobacteriaceae bacterium]
MDLKPNAHQLALLRSYPGISVLPFHPDDYGQIERAIATGDCADHLFIFLWTMLADLPDGDRAAAATLIDSAMANLSAVRNAVASGGGRNPDDPPPMPGTG